MGSRPLEPRVAGTQTDDGKYAYTHHTYIYSHTPFMENTQYLRLGSGKGEEACAPALAGVEDMVRDQEHPNTLGDQHKSGDQQKNRYMHDDFEET